MRSQLLKPGNRLRFVAGGLVVLCVAMTVSLFFDQVRRSVLGSTDPIVVESEAQTIRSGSPGDRVPVAYRLLNRSRRSVRIVGCQANCSCIVMDQAPFVLKPGAEFVFRASVALPKSKDGRIDFDYPITLYTNQSEQPRLELHLIASVRESG